MENNRFARRRPDTDLGAKYRAVRSDTDQLCDGLSEADAVVQSMDDASPAKWHLAHTTWFFETFLLKPHLPGYTEFDPAFGFLFNSYYEGAGERHARPQRGMITRPSLETVFAYRRHVDEAMSSLLRGYCPDILELATLGLHHEQQHQELLLTDLLHLFAQNPTHPAYRGGEPLPMHNVEPDPLTWHQFDGGLVDIGADDGTFHFDCEGPRHKALVHPFELASRTVTAGEWIEFIEDGGYVTPSLWLSDGWARVQSDGWSAPLYWAHENATWQSMTLRGFQPVDHAAPVCHVSYFEADAFASWIGARLPTEFEWEHAAAKTPVTGNLVTSGRLRPRPQRGGETSPVGLFGDVWEWTSSAFLPFPGYKPLDGTVGEYNGKFMSGQMVLRGGSCATPDGHIRSSYRNFFQPEKRWQYSGLRLARDAD
ncbi:MAG: ergothioneine biosynthesis protein EgtB [Pseudomonadota bacterium]